MTKLGGSLLAILLATVTSFGAAGEPLAPPSSAALAESMRQAMSSDGFEARMIVTVTAPDGHRSAPFKVSVIGQFDRANRRLLIRGISPDRVRNRCFAAERAADGHIRSIECRRSVSDGGVEADPFAKLFDSGLVLWDMLGPWWNWPTQILGRTREIAGHHCTDIRSQAEGPSPRIREVVSCVDTSGSLATRTLLFDGRHALVRTIVVEQMISKGAGLMTAKRLSITDADNQITEVEVYGGDEHYLITDDTFAALESHAARGE